MGGLLHGPRPSGSAAPDPALGSSAFGTAARTGVSSCHWAGTDTYRSGERLAGPPSAPPPLGETALSPTPFQKRCPSHPNQWYHRVQPALSLQPSGPGRGRSRGGAEGGGRMQGRGAGPRAAGRGRGLRPCRGVGLGPGAGSELEEGRGQVRGGLGARGGAGTKVPIAVTCFQKQRRTRTWRVQCSADISTSLLRSLSLLLSPVPRVGQVIRTADFPVTPVLENLPWSLG